ncbi:hypothetical protein [Actinomyces succiniciruminis]|uniref:Uncharacterized protein n=1 Tax=Actinomyces succiniciruminis TaxID=1522002 RepID=A0A1L7RKH2_9ACTO|nr:hypothetical protein [Actinomyces succiniciruminis]CED90600.1 Hypothetical protein AAM4_0768 [Actinomyces succiniciruminis]
MTATATPAPLGVMLHATCDMDTLLEALAAVVPHVGSDKAGPGCERLRLVLDVEAMRLCLLATDSESAIMASVPLEDADDAVVIDDDDGPGVRVVDRVDLDLSAGAAKTIFAVFKRVAGETVRLDVPADGRSVQVTDTSGMLVGRTVRVAAMGEWGPVDDEQRVDAAALIAHTCAAPLALQTTCSLLPKTLARWSPTAKALGVLPLRVTAGGMGLVAYGDLADADNLVVLGCLRIHGTVDAVPASEAAYDGPATAVLMDLLLDGSPVGGEATEEVSHAMVTELSAWLHEQDDTDTDTDGGGEPDGDGDDGDPNDGGDAA